MTYYCYNCNSTITKQNKSKEHIPAKALFYGYNDIKYHLFKRITVWGCRDCNNQYSTIDEEFRNLIGTINNSPQREALTKKSILSILRLKKNHPRLKFDNQGRIAGVTFDVAQLELFHIKNFKGIFYHEYGLPISDNYEILVNINEADYSDGLLGSIGYLQNNFSWKKSGHEDIFRYIIQPFRENLPDGIHGDIKPEEIEPFFLSLMEYNKSHAALVIAQLK
ncbi:MAG: hypothetical protein JW973_07115 [Bacteroidales bacterium]|nr:hypothetical protein [Bacteroidales bacterium]